MKRIISLALCFSLLGVTAAPGYILPCCCKGMSKSAVAEKSRHCCKSQPSLDSISDSKPLPCCANRLAGQSQTYPPDSSDQSCCSAKKLKKECPICRCLEQMQIVALSENVSLDVGVKHLVFVSSESVDLSATGLTWLSSALANSYSGAAPIGLKTCSLRC